MAKKLWYCNMTSKYRVIYFGRKVDGEQYCLGNLGSSSSLSISRNIWNDSGTARSTENKDLGCQKIGAPRIEATGAGDETFFRCDKMVRRRFLATCYSEVFSNFFLLRKGIPSYQNLLRMFFVKKNVTWCRIKRSHLIRPIDKVPKVMCVSISY